MPYGKFNSECLSTNIFVLTALQKRADEINVRASDMWSFSILLWELTTREVPFSDLSPMEVGMKVVYCILTQGSKVLGRGEVGTVYPFEKLMLVAS